jgi:starch synthase
MNIVMVSPECAPVAKAGGLGDVIHGLSKELAARGNAVEVLLPKYDCMRYDGVVGLQKSYGDLWVPFHNLWIHCDVYFGYVDGLRCYFIDPHSHHNFFNRGKLYGEGDDAERFAFFSRAVMEFLFKAGKHPDVIHCHDWQTGLVPVLLYEMYKQLGMTHPRVCYTLHNVGHQGVTGEHILRQVGLNARTLMAPERLLDHTSNNAVNIMKGGIVYSNFITTVSPRYAGEIRYTDQGRGLQQILNVHGAKFGGVLNGVDYDVWDPKIDRFIACRYAPDALEEKSKNTQALRQRLMLRDASKPIVAVISRLDRQKGTELMRHAVYFTLANNSQFVLLGAASEPSINEEFWRIKRDLKDNPDCHLELGYDDELAHQIYAGADMIVIPSVYEPCGLTQMFALKYGVVPIVRNTGGLADTVFDANYSDKSFQERNGYVFHGYTTAELESAMRRAIGLWYRYPEYFRRLRLNGMHCDYSWNHPATHYLNIYRYICTKR